MESVLIEYLSALKGVMYVWLCNVPLQTFTPQLFWTYHLFISMVFEDPLNPSDRTSFQFQLSEGGIIVFASLEGMHFMQTICRHCYKGLFDDS